MGGRRVEGRSGAGSGDERGAGNGRGESEGQGGERVGERIAVWLRVERIVGECEALCAFACCRTDSLILKMHEV